MTDATNGVYTFKPTLKQRFWRALGFHFHLGEEPEGIDRLPGWMKTEISLNFGWIDRLRLLMTGRLRVHSTVYFDTPSPMVCKSRVDWHALPPGACE